MPELPEVETIRRGLKTKILNKKIKSIKVEKPNLVRNNLLFFKKTLKDKKIKNIDRVGKLLILDLEDEQNHLLVHLKMTGQLIYQKKDKIIAGGHNLPIVDRLPNKYSYIILTFDDGGELFFNDMRQFGFWQILNKDEKEITKAKYGPEPGNKNFTWQSFKKALDGRKSILKPTLLNQQIIAGIGNIYADEICFRARVLPNRKINTLSDFELKKIYQASKYIIKKAIAKKGTTFSDYRNAEGHKGSYVKYLKVFGRQKQDCFTCKNKIVKIKLGGRGTHYCTKCQK